MRGKAGGDKALLSYSSEGRRDAGMHTHMQIGRLARHARQQAPDLCRQPCGTTTSWGLIRLVLLPTPAAGRGTGCHQPCSGSLLAKGLASTGVTARRGTRVPAPTL